MGWAARLGTFFALGWLVLLWPELAALLHDQLPPLRLAALVAAVAVYVAGTRTSACGAIEGATCASSSPRSPASPFSRWR
jgi:hypothetical protein